MAVYSANEGTTKAMTYENYYQTASTVADTILAGAGPSPETAGTYRRGLGSRSTDVQKSRLKAAAETGIQMASAGDLSQDTVAVRMLTALREAKNPEQLDIKENLASTVTEMPGRWIEGDVDYYAVAKSIKDIESSGGDYSVRGPVVKKGQYKGQRAMGAYQVMPGNLPSWSKAAIGRVVSEEEFMSSPAIQDAIFIDQMKKSKAKYGTIEDAVSVWFSGQPVSKSKNASDGYMSAPAYLSKFQNGYNMYTNTAR